MKQITDNWALLLGILVIVVLALFIWSKISHGKLDPTTQTVKTELATKTEK